MIRVTQLLLASLAATGCGPRAPVEPTTPTYEGTGGSEAAEADDGMVVAGLTGTLRRDEVDPVMNSAVSRFMRCYAEELDALPVLSGDLSLGFTVAPDGSVAEVRTLASTLGSRATEECILQIGRGLRFPRPHGGQANFEYGPVLFNPGEGSPTAALWDPTEVSEALAARATEVEACGASSGVSVTLYIGPGGSVRSIGAVPESADRDEAARCLERVLSSVTFADPGARVTKVTLEL